jgi:hypothetical protein
MDEHVFKKTNRNRHTVRRRRGPIRVCCDKVFDNIQGRRYLLHMKLNHPGEEIKPMRNHAIVAHADITTNTLISHLRGINPKSR